MVSSVCYLKHLLCRLKRKPFVRTRVYTSRVEAATQCSCFCYCSMGLPSYAGGLCSWKSSPWARTSLKMPAPSMNWVSSTTFKTISSEYLAFIMRFIMSIHYASSVGSCFPVCQVQGWGEKKPLPIPCLVWVMNIHTLNVV